MSSVKPRFIVLGPRLRALFGSTFVRIDFARRLRSNVSGNSSHEKGGNMDWSEIATWVAGVVALGIGGGLVFRFVSSKNTSVRVTSQKNNRAGGDIIGGDSVKKTDK